MSAIGPGGTIGVIGGGQLARMLALEGRRMGYRIAVMDPDPLGPAGQVADSFVAGRLDDVDAATRLAAQSDVITIDTEHVPAEVLESIESSKPVRPASKVLRIVQDRLRQRRFLDAHGYPQVRTADVSSEETLREAADALGFPCILKTRRSGYDGRGQIRIDRAEAVAPAWKTLGGAPSVLEAFVDFDREVAVLVARDERGNLRFHPTAENLHRRHILHTTRVPARLSAELDAHAREIAGGIAATLEYVGMMAVEFFVTRAGALLVNEIAPRTHNSGHYTFGACVTSQFEQHLRAICGLPLGDTSLLRPAVMLNLLGDLWQAGTPDWAMVLSHPTAALHLYGKRVASPGRKMGHVLVLEESAGAAEAVADRIDKDLRAGGPPLGGERT